MIIGQNSSILSLLAPASAQTGGGLEALLTASTTPTSSPTSSFLNIINQHLTAQGTVTAGVNPTDILAATEKAKETVVSDLQQLMTETAAVIPPAVSTLQTAVTADTKLDINVATPTIPGKNLVQADLTVIAQQTLDATADTTTPQTTATPVNQTAEEAAAQTVATPNPTTTTASATTVATDEAVDQNLIKTQTKQNIDAQNALLVRTAPDHEEAKVAATVEEKERTKQTQAKAPATNAQVSPQMKEQVAAINANADTSSQLSTTDHFTDDLQVSLDKPITQQTNLAFDNSVKLTTTQAQPKESVVASPAVQVTAQLEKEIGSGKNKIIVQLHPEELGKVEVRVEYNQLDHTKHAKISIVADNNETLLQLQKDSKDLIKGLNQAGLQTDANSLDFSLGGDQQRGTKFAFDSYEGFKQQMQQSKTDDMKANVTLTETAYIASTRMMTPMGVNLMV